MMTEERLKRKLEALMLAELYQPLLAMRSLRLKDIYVLRDVLDVGGQGILFLAEDSEQPGHELLVKMPFLPYHRPAYLDLETVRRARASLLWEAYVLSIFPGTIFPEYYDFFFDMNPLQAREWGSEITEQEPYLVMEFVQGRALDAEIGKRHRVQPVDHAGLEILALTIAQQFLGLCETLWIERRLLYTDLRPRNILLTDLSANCQRPDYWRRRTPHENPLPPCKVDAPVRIIDVGSTVWAKQGNGLTLPYHPAYVPPTFHESCQAGRLSWPDRPFVLYTLGKTLYQVVTNLEPEPGKHPSFAEQILRHYSQGFVTYLRDLIIGRWDNFEAPRQIALRLTAIKSARE